MRDRRAETVAAFATGTGVGFLVLMIMWLVAARLTSTVWEAPTGPVVALFVAVVSGVVASVFAIRRLYATVPPAEA